jgi:cobyrinic acid a,c-diamide synthase
VVCNRVGSRSHLEILRKACAGEPRVLGGLPVEAALGFPERHLGLHTADRDQVPEARFAAWGERAAEWLDLDALIAAARSAPALEAAPAAARAAATLPACRIGLALDEAFHFYYDDNLRRLETLGAELVRFSPVHDVRLPDVDGLYLGGGYPEVHAAALSSNTAMRDAIAAFARAGGPIYAECGGLMYLARAIRTLDGQRHAMLGVLPAEVEMRERLVALGYVEVELQAPSLLGEPGLRFRGHQFRYSELRLTGEVDQVYTVRRRRGGDVAREGYRVGNALASYVHAHWASNPGAARALVAACVAHRRARPGGAP